MDDKKDKDLNALVRRAQDGDHGALEQVVRSVQNRVHHLAMRMLVNPEDALDATQEILILVATKLSTFRGDSAFTTWVYRVAANYLLTARKVINKEEGLTFELFKEDLETGLVTNPAPAADDKVMLNQLWVSCTMAMLLCLDLKHRVAYVLGDILELDHDEASQILEISKANYRQRLSRARREVVAFTSKSCGIVNKTAKCSCPKRLPAAKAAGRVSAEHLFFNPADAPDYDAVIAEIETLKEQLATAHLQNATPFFKSPADLRGHIAEILRVQT